MDWNTYILVIITCDFVTSLAEVWIEICNCEEHYYPVSVTSLAEVWIEILYLTFYCPVQWVTSLAEVWIEIAVNCNVEPGFTGHFPCGSVDWNIHNSNCKLSFNVTSLAEVWIEIGILRCGVCIVCRHFPCGSVDWNFHGNSIDYFFNCHFPCGSVDWNMTDEWAGSKTASHFPCGSVDWNWIKLFVIVCLCWSLPLRKCGLKYRGLHNHKYPSQSLPLRKCGLKLICRRKWRTILSHFPCGSVDWNMVSDTLSITIHSVTSLAEVWIEIIDVVVQWHAMRSLPLRKCGLKSVSVTSPKVSVSHFPCGSVDWNKHVS